MVAARSPIGVDGRVHVTLVEESYVNTEGGRGWIDEYWSVYANDGWARLSQLVRCGTMGEIAAVEERFDQLPAGRRSYRVVTIGAPIGTLVMKRVRRSEFDGEIKTVLELRSDGRLARPRSEVEGKRAANVAPAPQLSAESIREHADALLARLRKAS